MRCKMLMPGGLRAFVLLWREDLATVRLADHHLGPIDHCLRCMTLALTLRLHRALYR